MLLQEKLPSFLGTGISNSKVRRLIMAGKVFVNQKQCRVPSFIVFFQSKVSVEIDEEKLFYEKETDDIKFELTENNVLFEDDYLLAVNKPSHFPSDKSIVESRNNLSDEVKKYLFKKQKELFPNLVNQPYSSILHRLDRDTSGVILFSKKREVNNFCHEMFEKHLVKKEYLALVNIQIGAEKYILQNEFTVDFPLGRISLKSQAAKWGKVPVEKGGKEAETHFKIEKKINKNLCLIRCFPKTGRTHQIRVHLSSVGLPIVGDFIYGNKNFERILLHCQKLTFPHPVTKNQIEVISPLPKEFNLLIKEQSK